MEQLPLGVQLRERASFEGFVTGHNLEAVTRVQAAALQRSRAVLWLWGAAGCGRSHLLLAACAAAPLFTALHTIWIVVNRALACADSRGR